MTMMQLPAFINIFVPIKEIRLKNNVNNVNLGINQLFEETFKIFIVN
jgi:hypothetical protein